MGDEHTTAWYELHVNSVDDDQRLITGIATTPEPDRRGDIIDPLGAMYAAEIPLLLHHDKERPVGVARLGVATPAGIPFTAQLSRAAAGGSAALRERLEEAWQSVKDGLLKGVSIGYRAVPEWMKPLRTGGFLFVRSEIVELSLVTVPSNPAAVITGIKAMDLAASGRHLSAVADASSSPTMQAQTIQEQITHWQGVRGPLVQKMADMLNGRTTTLDGNEQKAYDGYADQVTAIDGTLSRLAVLESANRAAAVPIAAAVPAVNMTAAATTRPALVQVRSAELPKGALFVRAAMCLARSKGDGYQALQYARSFDSTPEVELIVKAAVAPGTTTDPAWAAALVQVRNAMGEFIDLLRPATILGKMPIGGTNGLRKVPFNTSVPAQTAGGSYGWVGQAAPKPVTKLAFGTSNLGVSKAAGIIIITEELARLSDPAAEDLVRNDMIKGIGQFLDGQLIDEAIAAVPQVSPASLTNGIAPLASAGPVDDLFAVLAAFAGDDVPLGAVTIIMSETNAFALGWARDPVSGARLFPGIGVNGGTVEGFTVITSNTAAGRVIGVACPYILLADDGQVVVDVSREASIQMDTAPANPADATTVFTSLWQNNLVGLRAERWINWLRVTPKAVHWVNNANYAPTMAGLSRASTVRVEPVKNHKPA